MNMLNRLTNYFSVSYVITNNLVANNYDAEGIEQLIKHLRYLLANHSMHLVAKHVPISRGRLGDFKNGDIICMRYMHELASYFKISHIVYQLHKRINRNNITAILARIVTDEVKLL